MTALPGMMLWTDAYMADTSHLTTTEHGAYLLILMAMWRAGGKLPNDDIRLARTARMTIDKWRKIAPTVLDFMTVEDGLITQKRLQQEFKIASGTAEKRSAAGQLGGYAKALKSKKRDLGPAKAEAKPGSTIHTNTNTNTKKEEEASPTEMAPVAPPEDQDASLFRRGREVLGRNAGGQVAKLKAAFDGSIAKARGAVEIASTKDQPAEYLAKVIANVGRPSQPRAGPSRPSVTSAVAEIHEEMSRGHH